eukprot:6208006-Pleurochrysis_carterae.AAC.1
MRKAVRRSTSRGAQEGRARARPLRVESDTEQTSIAPVASRGRAAEGGSGGRSIVERDEARGKRTTCAAGEPGTVQAVGPGCRDGDHASPDTSRRVRR